MGGEIKIVHRGVDHRFFGGGARWRCGQFFDIDVQRQQPAVNMARPQWQPVRVQRLEPGVSFGEERGGSRVAVVVQHIEPAVLFRYSDRVLMVSQEQVATVDFHFALHAEFRVDGH